MTARPKTASDLFDMAPPSDVTRARCHVLNVQVSLFEIEECTNGAPWQAWPEVPRKLVEREVNGWLARAVGISISGAIPFCIKAPGKVGCCGVTIYHSAPPAADPPRASSGDAPPAGQGLAGSPAAQPIPEQCRIGGCGE